MCIRDRAPNARDYSIFIHLVSNDGLTVAQTDTMPGAGLLLSLIHISEPTRPY